MCCTIEKAKLSDTLLYAGEAYKNDRLVHVLAYQNTADNLTGNPNAMVLPFPNSAPMSEKNMIDTTSFKSFLEDITSATKQDTRMMFNDSDDLIIGCAGGALVFDVGSYTVVLAERVSQIPEALTRVPERRRPTISYRFLFGYSDLYKDCSIAICCWDGYIKAEPLLWWYEPKDIKNLFVPTMDAHDGNSPNLNAVVSTDHIVSAGSKMSNIGSPVIYSEQLSDEAKELLPSHVHGSRLGLRMKNGDTFVDLESVKTKKYGAIIKRGKSIDNIDSEDNMYGWY